MSNKTEQEVDVNEIEELRILRRSLQRLREMKDIQCSDGNWNYDPYMQGMANGIIFSLSLLDDKEPEYMEAPEEWLKDKKDTENLSSQGGEG